MIYIYIKYFNITNNILLSPKMSLGGKNYILKSSLIIRSPEMRFVEEKIYILK